MAKKTNPKKKEETACRQLSELQTEDLARLIISEAGCTDISRGTGSRKKRGLPPAGTVMIFLTGEFIPLPPITIWRAAREKKSTLRQGRIFDFLYRSALRYSGLGRPQASFPPDQEITEDEHHQTVPGNGHHTPGACQPGRGERKAVLLPLPVP